MRLVIATPLYPGESGGPATLAKMLEEGLPAHGWTGVTIPFEAVRHLPKFVRPAAYFWQVFTLARKSDCVLALDPVSVGLPALLAARLAWRPFYLYAFEDYAFRVAQSRGIGDALSTFACKRRYPLAIRMLKAFEAYVATASVRILVPDAGMAKIVRLWNVPHGRIAVVDPADASAVASVIGHA